MPRICCPGCHVLLKAKQDPTGRTVTCPKCSHAFVVTSLVPEPPPVVEVLAAPPPPPVVPPLPAIKTTPPGRQYVSTSTGSRSKRGGRVISSPRETRRFLFFLIWIAPFVSIHVVGSIANEYLVRINAQYVVTNVLAPGLMMIYVPAIVWLFVGFYPTKWWVLPYVMSQYATGVRCPGCRDVIPARDKWNCGCGYHAHRTTSVFSRKCPSCGAEVGHINCPRCDVTILM